MNLKEHRIYQYLSEPVTIIGLTLDELALSAGGLAVTLYAETFSYKTGGLVASLVGVYALKKIKKVNTGFSVGSFLHWHFGFMPGRSSSWPESWKRFWL